MKLIPLTEDEQGDLCAGEYYIGDSLIEFDVVNQDYAAYMTKVGDPSFYLYVYQR